MGGRVGLARLRAEVVKLTALIDSVDAALADGVVERRGKKRELLDSRRRLSKQLEAWYGALGMTPNARATWAAKLTEKSVWQQLREELAGDGR